MRVALFAVIVSALSYRQMRTWASDRALWDHALSVSGQKPRVLLYAGLARAESGEQIAACQLLTRSEHAPIRPSDEWAPIIHRAAMLNVQSLC